MKKLKLKILLICLLSIILICCKKKSQETNEISNPEFTFPIIKNTSSLKNIEPENELWLGRKGKHYIFYIGELKDTIIVDQNLMKIVPPPPNSPLPTRFEELNNLSFQEVYPDYYIGWQEDRFYPDSDSIDLLIQLDTIQKLNNNNVLSDVVMLYNSSSDTIVIGYGNIYSHHIPAVLEAKNTAGEWTAIEKPFMYGCGNGVGTIILPPHEIVLTSVNVQSGEFRTKLRLRMGKNISNEYVGYINETQFVNEWDHVDK